MKLLVTGGTGLLGQHFINRYPEHEYTVLSRSFIKAKSLLPDNVDVIDDLMALKNLNTFDGVINLAGEAIVGKRWTKKQKARIQSSRFLITERLVALMAKSHQPPAIFISASAVGIYSATGLADLKDENTHDAVQDFGQELCSQWESIANKASRYSRTVLLRLGVVLSAEGGALKKMLLPARLGLLGPLGDGQQYISWVHIDDFCQAISHIIDTESIKGAVNITAPTAVTNTEFTKVLTQQFRRKPFFPVPAPVMTLLLGESALLVLKGQNVYPRVLLNSGFMFNFSYINQAFSDLV